MRLRISILSLLLLLSPRPVGAVIYTWSPAAGGLTNTSVNWSPSGVPGANDDTRYWQSGVTYTVTMAAPADTCNTVWASSTGHPQFSCGDPLRVRNSFQVDGGTTASIIAGTADAGWFTVGPGTFTMTGNGTKVYATNSSAYSYFGNSSGFTSTVNVGGGATFVGHKIRVPEITGCTGILNVSGHPTGGVASSLQTDASLDVGYQGVGDVELSAGANIQADEINLGSYAYGKLHLFRGTGVFATAPSLSVAYLLIGSEYIDSDGNPGGTGVLSVDQGSVNVTFETYMGDDDGGGPDSLRMNGGSVYLGGDLYQKPNYSSVLDLHGGSLFVNDPPAEATGSTLYQPVPLSVDGAGAGPILTFSGWNNSVLDTTTPLSLIVGRSGGGSLNVVGTGFDPPQSEFLGVQGSAVVADMGTGTGIITANEAAEIGIGTTLTVGPGNGLVQARGGSWITANEMDVVGSATTGGTLASKDTLSLLMPTALAVGGTMTAPAPGMATALIDSLGGLEMQDQLVRIWGGGGKLEVGHGGTAFVDTALCSGEVQLAGGTIADEYGKQAFHLLNGGFMHGVGTVRTAVALDDTSARLETLASDPPGILMVGDSLRTDSFRSQGTVRVEADTLAIVIKGVPDLGHVVLAGGTLRLPGGGHLRVADVLEGNGRLEGSLSDDGLVNATGEIDIAGHLTVLAGDVAGNGGTVLTGGELSARGHVSGLMSLGGQLDMGTSLAKLTLTRAPLLQPTNELTMRIGSEAHGAQDTLVVSEAFTCGGTLDLRTWKPDPSAAGDTLTLVTAPSVSGSFSKVTIDGVDAPSYVQVIYEPARVRVAVLQSTVDVPAPQPGHANIALRFAASGTLRSPAFALDLPRPSTVVLDVYNVAGRRIAELENGRLDAGRYRFPFSGAPGVYYAQASILDQTGRRALTAHVVQLP
jgi:hypothetical protein